MVEVIDVNWRTGEGTCSKIFERKSFLQDPKVANINQVIVQMALSQPEFHPWKLTQFLVLAEQANVKVMVFLNKTDLASKKFCDEKSAMVRSWGYDVFPCSASMGYNLDKIKELLKDKVSAVVGPSGAGKSSLINAIKLDAYKDRLDQTQEAYPQSQDNNRFQHWDQLNLINNLDELTDDQRGPNLENYDPVKQRLDINKNLLESVDFKSDVQKNGTSDQTDNSDKQNQFIQDKTDVNIDTRGQKSGSEMDELTEFRMSLQNKYTPKSNQDQNQEDMQTSNQDQDQNIQHNGIERQDKHDKSLQDNDERYKDRRGNMEKFQQTQEGNKTVNIRETSQNRKRDNYVEEQQISQNGTQGVLQPQNSENKIDVNEIQEQEQQQQKSGYQQLQSPKDQMYSTEKTSAVTKHGKGKHCTTQTKLILLPGGGFLCDTPGKNDPQYTLVEPEELQNMFPEIQSILENDSCRFNDCQHINEPDCCVKNKWFRYDHYKKIHEDLQVQRQQKISKGLIKKKNQSTTKTKVEKGGVFREEILLDPKKYKQKQSQIDKEKEESKEV